MGDNSYKYILDRDDAENIIKTHFQDTIKLIKSIVNYGTYLIPRCFGQSDRKLEDIVIIGALLKHIVSMIDGIDALISQGSVYAAHLQARSLLEAFLNLKYIIEFDTEKLSKYYYVWNLRQKRKWALIYVPSTNEHELFLIKSEKCSGILIDSAKKYSHIAIEQIDAIDSILSKESFLEINQEFERFKKRRKYDVPWYKPTGVSSISALAHKVGYGAEYEVFYSQYSGIMHATEQFINITFEENSIIFEPIRKLDDMRTLIQVALGFTIKTYILILEKYRPIEKENFLRKYVQDWRNAYLSIKEISYNNKYHSNIIL